MVLLGYLHEPDPRRISRLFFIHFVAPCAALHLADNYYFKSFYEDLHVALHTSVGCISPECQQDRTLLRNQYYWAKTFLIFDINHQQNTRRSDQIETIKR